MLKEFAQYLVSLKDNKTYDIHGDTYSDTTWSVSSPTLTALPTSPSPAWTAS